MAKKSKVLNKSFDFQIRNIDLFEFEMHRRQIGHQTDSVGFDIMTEAKINQAEKLIHILVNIDICTLDKNFEFAKVGVTCTFYINNFNDALTDENGETGINGDLLSMLNSISISTSRGVIYTMFKGTHLSGATLPIVDPKNFEFH